jgi:hypothetical protein
MSSEDSKIDLASCITQNNYASVFKEAKDVNEICELITTFIETPDTGYTKITLEECQEFLKCARKYGWHPQMVIENNGHLGYTLLDLIIQRFEPVWFTALLPYTSSTDECRALFIRSVAHDRSNLISNGEAMVSALMQYSSSIGKVNQLRLPSVYPECGIINYSPTVQQLIFDHKIIIDPSIKSQRAVSCEYLFYGSDCAISRYLNKTVLLPELTSLVMQYVIPYQHMFDRRYMKLIKYEPSEMSNHQDNKDVDSILEGYQRYLPHSAKVSFKLMCDIYDIINHLDRIGIDTALGSHITGQLEADNKVWNFDSSGDAKDPNLRFGVTIRLNDETNETLTLNFGSTLFLRGILFYYTEHNYDFSKQILRLTYCNDPLDISAWCNSSYPTNFP